MLTSAGEFFFRYRNMLFPVVFAGLLMLSQPRAFGGGMWDGLAFAGVTAIAAGQLLRVVTIGLDYVKRGGKKKRIYAERLVTQGMYAHCRNPMYVGNILVAFGLLMLASQPWIIVLGGGFFLFVYISIVRSEERYLLLRFGDEYREYCASSPRWMVRVTGVFRTLRQHRFDWRAVIVKEYGTLFCTLFITTALFAWKIHRAGLLSKFAPYLMTAAALWVILYFVARWLKKGREMKPRGPRLVADHTLEQLRTQIDYIDGAILDLLNQRATEVGAIYHLKGASGIRRIDPQRTEKILQRLISLNRGPLSSDDVRRLYSDLLWHFAHEFQTDTPEPEQPIVHVLTRAVERVA